jgi:hypothetical protein
MRRKRRTITALALLTLAFATLSIATAGANSLLSGYGGPGEGNQAILGSALINGPSGKGGSGGGRSDGGTGAAAHRPPEQVHRRRLRRRQGLGIVRYRKRC